jgi:hypothetical protein
MTWAGVMNVLDTGVLKDHLAQALSWPRCLRVKEGIWSSGSSRRFPRTTDEPLRKRISRKTPTTLASERCMWVVDASKRSPPEGASTSTDGSEVRFARASWTGAICRRCSLPAGETQVGTSAPIEPAPVGLTRPYRRDQIHRLLHRQHDDLGTNPEVTSG